MPSRHRSRERALQMIYQWDLTRAPVAEVTERYRLTLALNAGDAGEKTPDPDPFAERLFETVASEIDKIDDLIGRHAAHWRLDRMSAVDRNILRLGVAELIGGTAAPAVIINEAMQVGRRFSARESGPFLNGVLDAIRKRLEESDRVAKESPPPPHADA